MKVETKTVTTISKVALTRKEKDILISAQTVVNNLCDALEIAVTEEVEIIDNANYYSLINTVKAIGSNLICLITLVGTEKT